MSAQELKFTNTYAASILLGLVAGQRPMTPLAAIAGTARHGSLPYDNPAARLMSHSPPVAGGIMLAAGEVAGDKMKNLPGRAVAPGLIAGAITGSFAGAAMAPPKRQAVGAVLGLGAGLTSSFLGLAPRKRAIRRWGQTLTGFAEGVITTGAANAVAHARLSGHASA